MQATIEPGSINGRIAAPPSKSMTQRAYAAALLHGGATIIHHPGNSDDEQAALAIVRALGAAAELLDNGRASKVTSTGVVSSPGSISCGESGLAARLFTPIAALSSQPLTISGSGSLLQRPMHGFAEVLPQLGVLLKDFDGHLPVTLQGPLQPVSISLDASSGSQFLSGLLFALSHAATAPITITVAGLASRPYIDMTIQMLAHFGKPITHNNYKEFYIDPALFTHQETIEINIEGDWSSASALLVAGAIAGDITVANLDPNSKQADTVILNVLRQAGAGVTIEGEHVAVKMAPLRAFEFDATHSPDLFPVLAILASCCHGESYIHGVHRLFHKESNRAASITDMLSDLDVPFSLEDDSLCITGVRRLRGTIIDAHNDHRIVMAAAIAALRARGPIDITGADAVDKSYPSFFEHLSSCGVVCKLA